MEKARQSSSVNFMIKNESPEFNFLLTQELVEMKILYLNANFIHFSKYLNLIAYGRYIICNLLLEIMRLPVLIIRIY